jgi:hypothetical protein
MIDAQRIDMIIQEGEGLTVEFKEHFSTRIVEDVTAFSGKYRSDEMNGSPTSSSGWTRSSLPAQVSEG